MIRTIIAVLLTVILVAALAAGLWMLFSGRKGRKVSVSVVADEADPCPVSMVEVGGSTVRIFFIPSPAELEEVEACTESPGALPMDEGPTDIERLVGGALSGDALRQTLVELQKSGMKVSDDKGKAVSPKDLLAEAGSAERELAPGEKNPPVDPEPQVHHEQRNKRHRRTKAEMQKAREAQASAEAEVHKTVMA